MIAIIPARGGSKGLPGKNIKELNGKPLIAYTIEAAMQAEKISDVFVTTDSLEIAEIAIKYGAKIPFMRPEELATDTASAVDVYIHAMDYFNSIGINDKHYMILLPTAPLRDAKNIDEAIAKFEEASATTLISVTDAPVPISWFLKKDQQDMLCNANFTNEDISLNRQNNEKYYVPNGAIYILEYNLLKSKRTYYTKNTVAYIMSREKSIDIDEKLDFQFAEYLLNG